jgi:predicted membrane chloride channel (bestrophin family)
MLDHSIVRAKRPAHGGRGPPQEQMAMEIEQPFGDDEDDLPLENYCLDIEKILLDVLNEGPEAPQ